MPRHYSYSSPRGYFYAIIMVTAAAFYVLGKTVSLSVKNVDCSRSPEFAQMIEERVEQLVLRRQSEILAEYNELMRRFMREQRGKSCDCERQSNSASKKDSISLASPTANNSTQPFFSLISMENLASVVSLGIPVDVKNGEKAIVLQNQMEEPEERPLRKCDSVNVLVADQFATSNSCTVIVPQKNSLHSQLHKRVNQDGHLDSSKDLQLVSSGSDGKGHAFEPPKQDEIRVNWKVIQQYLGSVDEAFQDLRPVLQDISVDNTVTVMVCNLGQTDLLINFACSAFQRGIDLSSVLVFATDQQTADVAKRIGLSVYFDERVFGKLPLEASEQRGDHEFTAMMMAKVICVQLVSFLGYDVLYQDVDIVWFRNPLNYMREAGATSDIVFQYDHNTESRFAPFFGNTGLFFVRSNSRTRYMLTSLVMQSDLIWSTESHTAAMTAILNEHVTRYGLSVHLLNKETELFPSGYHWNEEPNYMDKLWTGQVHPYLFHMSRTVNSEYKVKFFQQMGEWWVAENSTAKDKEGLCRKSPLFQCHDPSQPSRWTCSEAVVRAT